jgi:cytochrome oxidase assembly protein ShyY1
VAAKVLLVFLPLATLLILTALTLWGLKRHSDVIARLTSSDADVTRRRQKERQLTMMMLVATVAYVILSLPYGVHFLCGTLTDVRMIL